MIKRIFFYLKRKMLPAERYARMVGVNLGRNNFISTKYWGTEPYLITIGDHCQITAGVRFHTHGGAQVLRDKHPDFDFFGKIQVGNWVYIGTGAQILPGVTIGDGALVAAGSVVTKSVAPGMVVGGNPARVISNAEEFFCKMSPYNVQCKHLSVKDKKKFLLSLEENRFVHK